MVEQCNETVEQYWWNSVGAQWNSEVQQCGGTIEQSWWNSGTLMVEQCGERVEQ